MAIMVVYADGTLDVFDLFASRLPDFDFSRPDHKTQIDCLMCKHIVHVGRDCLNGPWHAQVTR
jgi:hypothetical protein